MKKIAQKMNLRFQLALRLSTSLLLLSQFQLCSGRSNWEFGRKTTTRRERALQSAKKTTGIVAKATKKSYKTITLTLGSSDVSTPLEYFSSHSYSYPFSATAISEKKKSKTADHKSSLPKTKSGPFQEASLKPTVKKSIAILNSTATLSEGDYPFTKVVCETNSQDIQRVDIRFTYELDFNHTTKAAAIDGAIFQSIVDKFLQCNNKTYYNRKLTTTHRKGRRALRKLVNNEKVVQIISLDRSPIDILQKNESCIPADSRSNCRSLNGAMTIEINQLGEENANIARFELLSFIKNSMASNLFNSAETGVTAMRYLGPDLDLLRSTSNYMSSVAETRTSVVPRNGSSPMHPIVFGFIGAGVLVLASMAFVFGIISRTRPHEIISSNDEESESFTITSLTAANKGMESTKDDEDEGFSSSSTTASRHILDGVTFAIPYGYTQLNCQDEQHNIPPPVCFDQSRLMLQTPPPSIVEEVEEKGVENDGEI